MEREQIIKANKCCYDNGDSCLNCPFMNDYESCVNLNKNTSTLIEELVKESEALEKVIADLTEENETLNIRCQTVRVDTVRKMLKMVEQAICDNTYPDFNKKGKPINVWKATTGFEMIDKIAKDMLEGLQ